MRFHPRESRFWFTVLFLGVAVGIGVGLVAERFPSLDMAYGLLWLGPVLMLMASLGAAVTANPLSAFKAGLLMCLTGWVVTAMGWANIHTSKSPGGFFFAAGAVCGGAVLVVVGLIRGAAQSNARS